MVAAGDQPTRHVAAHAAQTDECEFHKVWQACAGGRAADGSGRRRAGGAEEQLEFVGMRGAQQGIGAFDGAALHEPRE